MKNIWSFGLGTVLSIVGLLVLQLATIPGTNFQAQNLPSPDPDPVSGWEQIIPGTTTWEEASGILGRMGYTFDVPYQTDAVFGPIYSGYIIRSDRYTQVSVSISVKNDKVSFAAMLFRTGNPNIHIDTSDWSAIRPEKQIARYGEPTNVRLYVSLAEDGFRASLFLFWKQPGVAVAYWAVPLTLDEGPTALNLCFDADRVLEATFIHVIPNSDEDVIISFPETRSIAFMSNFKSDLLTNAASMQDVAATLASSRCLEAPYTTWLAGFEAPRLTATESADGR